MTAGIVLVHGYTGSPRGLDLLKRRLEESLAPVEATSVLLPGHGGDAAPAFAAGEYLGAVAAEAGRFQKAGRDVVLIGHSTGGVLALAAMAEHSITPKLLVLASVPNRIDGTYLERWRLHSAGKTDITFASMAHMVSLTNRIGSQARPGEYPVLIVHGERDELVPCREAFAWRSRFAGPVRTVIVPGAGHDPFTSGEGGFAFDVIVRAAADALHVPTDEEAETVRRLVAAEPSAARFLARSPGSAGHLARSPGARQPRADSSVLGAVATSEPVFANIEITTRCNLRCAFCARTSIPREERDMPEDRFGRLLDLLPHAWRITLVGLGEPLMHPGVDGFIHEGHSRGRRVALVTNALLLTEEMSRRLIAAGLDAVVFSLDAVVPGPAAIVRPGASIDTLIDNIKTFGTVSSNTRPVSKAVFSAVSTTTAPHLERLVETVARLGVDVLMLSDLNFAANLPHALWQNADERTRAVIHRAVRKAFSLRLPVLSVDGLEEFAPAARYRDSLLIPPSRLYHRSDHRRFCLSPWQTLPLDVDGASTLCDCQPGEGLGNVLELPFGEIWNGIRMRDHRRRMLARPGPRPCAVCPRY